MLAWGGWHAIVAVDVTGQVFWGRWWWEVGELVEEVEHAPFLVQHRLGH